MEATRTTRKRPGLFRALGDQSLPETVQVDGRCYSLETTYKHDSWAATGLYVGDSGRIVCKFHRTQRIGLLPARWMGRRVANHERHLLNRLAGLDGVPQCLSAVTVDGRIEPNAVARKFVAGEPLSASESGIPQFPDLGGVLGDSESQQHFMEQLEALIGELHQRRIAYVDLHKPENIIAGADGRPYLIDFQISFALPEFWLLRHGPLGWLLSVLQRCDQYHLRKLIVRHRHPDMPEPERRQLYGRPRWIGWHRAIAIPFRGLRRKLLVAIGVRSGAGQVTTEANPEVAFRGRSEGMQP